MFLNSRVLSILAMLVLMTPLAAATHCPLEGSGTEEDPWQVADCDDLGDIEPFCDLEDYYVLTADIDYSDCIPADPGLGYPGFDPIGSFGNRFMGVFDGQGHKISNLFIWQPAGNFVGLFGVIGSGGEVYDLVLEDVDISGRARVGGLVGVNFGHLESIYVSGEVNGWNYNILGGTGGLAGGSRMSGGKGTIVDCHSSADVTGTISVGGLVGFNEDLIINSSATGSVTGGMDEDIIDGAAILGEEDGFDGLGGVFIGGLVGRNGGFGILGEGTGLIAESFASGPVEGSFYVGGLVGGNLGGPDAFIVGQGVQAEAEEGMLGSNILALFEAEPPEEVSEILDNESAYSASLSADEMMGLVELETPCGFELWLDETTSVIAGKGPPMLDAYGVIIDSYSRGAVDAYVLSGGFAGINLGYIACAYSTGSVSGLAGIAGLTSMNDGIIFGSFSTGGVDAEVGMDNPSIGGLVGMNQFVIEDCYYNDIPENPDNCVGTDEGDTDCTAIDDNVAYFFDVADTSAPYDEWDFEEVWDTIFDDTCYPPFRWEGFTDGDGDGYAPESGVCPMDCDDGNRKINPARQEDCDNKRDDDCDGVGDCRDGDCRSSDACEKFGKVMTYLVTPGATLTPPPAGTPEISLPDSSIEGDEVLITVTGADGQPATGEITLTAPDGTKVVAVIIDGKVVYPLDQPGTWTVTYTDSEGRTAMKTIEVLPAPEGEVTQNFDVGLQDVEPDVTPAVTAGTPHGPDKLVLMGLGLLVLALVALLRRRG